MNMQNNTKKNVIFIIFDSLRYDRLGFGGHNPSPSPNIDKLLSSGLTLTNAFSTGCATEFAYPTLTTSTMSLDNGGYACGISGREITIAEVFKKEGYRTSIFFDDYYRSPSKYSRGYDDVFLLFDLIRFLADVGDTIPYFSNMLKNGKKSTEECIEALEEYLSVLFPDMIMYCKFMKESVEKDNLLPSLLLHNYDHAGIIDILTSAKIKYDAGHKKYILDLLNNKENIFDKILEIVKVRKAHPQTVNVDKYLRILLIKCLIYNVVSFIKGRASKKAVGNALRRVVFKQNRYVQFQTAAYIFNNFIHWIDKMPKDKPFFAWMHTADIHELNFASYDIPNGEEMVKKEVVCMSELYSEIASQKNNYYGNPLYDFSVKYTDIQVGRLINMLKDRDLLDNTLIVLTADHGHTSTEWPIRKNVHISRDFYDELYHVPVAFVNKDIKANKMEGMYSSLDILPTLLNLLNVQIPNAFRGEPVDPKVDTGRKYVIMEHLGPGPCDFKSKPIKICVRNSTHKLLYEILLPVEDHEGRISEIYDLLKDSLEQNNLAENKNIINEIQELLTIAKERAVEIQRQLK
ncbi:MAG: sulfatase-like hydrolase/transferase [Elusimicrobia bacterium]|nr:sulfatase-like hydrolase/transferase [Candidatus Liberimonas magnetica]